MFQIDGNQKRKRRRSSTGMTTTRRKLSVEPNDSPLRGVVVCLTGLPADEKIKFHQWVEDLGGRYARDLDTSTTTHLIAQDPEGAKYEAAMTCSNIAVVSPGWLEASVKSKRRAEESLFSWRGPEKELGGELEDNMLEDLSPSLDRLLQGLQPATLFCSCRFLLLGFEGQEELCNKFAKLIRRGRGTIYWELNELITHLIVHDDCTQEIRDAARTVSLHHPNEPASVSPLWVIQSCDENRLLETAKYPPRRIAPKPLPAVKKTKSKTQKRKEATGLFQGCVFALMRLSPPPDGVDYSIHKLEETIKSQSGQVLSSKLVDALHHDRLQGNQPKRKCYVVYWGGYTPAQQSVHPLLSRVIKLDICNVINVTPVWLEACVADQKPAVPERHPQLFQPKPWSFRKLPQERCSSSKGGGVMVAVTGFVGSERSGIVCLLRAIGATYTETMRNTNTHLICKENKGPKYEKAVQWGLHVVGLDWLFHIVQFGYGGKDGSCTAGCEQRFSLVSSDEEPEGEIRGNRTSNDIETQEISETQPT